MHTFYLPILLYFNFTIWFEQSRSKKIFKIFLQFLILESILSSYTAAFPRWQEITDSSCLVGSTAAYMPYLLPFIARHGDAILIAVPGSSFMISYIYAQQFTKKKPLVLIGSSALSIGILAYLKQFTDAITLLRLLLTDPLKVKKHNEMYIQNNQQSHNPRPLNAVIECCDDSCTLNRSLYPHCRTSFEQYIIQTLEPEVKCNTIVQYVSFGCGFLFQDVVILTQLLARHPYAKLTIHLIDPVVVQRKNDPEPLHVAQTKQWLTKMFPYASLYFFCYAHQNEYRGTDDTFTLIVGADIDKELDALQEYVTLCTRLTLACTEKVKNILLASWSVEQNKKEPALLSYNPSQGPSNIFLNKIPFHSLGHNFLLP